MKTETVQLLLQPLDNWQWHRLTSPGRSETEALLSALPSYPELMVKDFHTEPSQCVTAVISTQMAIFRITESQSIPLIYMKENTVLCTGSLHSPTLR